MCKDRSMQREARAAQTYLINMNIHIGSYIEPLRVSLTRHQNKGGMPNKAVLRDCLTLTLSAHRQQALQVIYAICRLFGTKLIACRATRLSKATSTCTVHTNPKHRNRTTHTHYPTIEFSLGCMNCFVEVDSPFPFSRPSVSGTSAIRPVTPLLGQCSTLNQDSNMFCHHMGEGE